jgi:hypothetical protein
MSAILELKTTADRAEEIIRIIQQVEQRLDTIVVLGVGTRCDASGDEHVIAPVLEKLGYTLRRAKTNIGLGRLRAAAGPAS